MIGPLPPPSGGMAAQLGQLVELLKSEGVTVNIVDVSAPYRPRWVTNIKGVRAAFRLFPYLFGLWKVANSTDIFHVMANSGWSWYLYAMPAVWIAKIKRKPVIVNYHGGEAKLFLRQSHRFVLPTLRLANGITVPSSFLYDVFGYWGVDTEVIPNIIDLDKFNRNNKLPSDLTITILVARNLELIYDNASALKAFALLKEEYPNAKLIIAGSGEEENNLRELAKEKGVADSTVFTGRIDNENMPSLYNAATVFLNPSLADNAPISILESLASGVPVVTTDVGGIPYMVEHEKTALLVKPGDYVDMKKQIVRLLSDDLLKNNLIDNGINIVSRYKWENIRSKLFSVYHQALKMQD